MPLLLKTLDADLDRVLRIFREQAPKPPTHDNQPLVAGALSWSNELRHRVDIPVRKLKDFRGDLLATPEGSVIREKHEEMVALLDAYDQELFARWAGAIRDVSADSLRQHLLKLNEDGRTVSVNFDSNLIALLREVKYLEFVGTQPVPELAASLFARNEAFRQQIAHLDIAVQFYNDILHTVQPFEAPLLKKRLDHHEAMLKRGMNELIWDSSAIDEYARSLREQITDTHQRLTQAKAHLKTIQDMMAKWCDVPFFERSGKKGVFNAADKHPRLESRYEAVRADGRAFHDLVTKTRDIFEAEESNVDWINYRKHVHAVVADGLKRLCGVSLTFFIENMDARFMASHELGALIHCKFTLTPPLMGFEPSMEQRDGAASLPGMFQELVGDVFHVGSLIESFVPASRPSDSSAEPMAAAEARAQTLDEILHSDSRLAELKEQVRNRV
jgi:dynein heavy chain, axonemal